MTLNGRALSDLPVSLRCWRAGSSSDRRRTGADYGRDRGATLSGASELRSTHRLWRRHWLGRTADEHVVVDLLDAPRVPRDVDRLLARLLRRDRAAQGDDPVGRGDRDGSVLEHRVRQVKSFELRGDRVVHGRGLRSGTTDLELIIHAPDPFDA